MANPKKAFIIDMDGVLVHGSKIIPGADAFIRQLRLERRKFLILTNNPIFTTRDLAHRLQSIGLDIPQKQIFTSALATCNYSYKTSVQMAKAS